MKNYLQIVVLIGLCAGFAAAQKIVPKNRPKAPLVDKTTVKTTDKKTDSAANAAPSFKADEGNLAGRTYTNESFGFEVTFPDSWFVPDKGFEAHQLKQGIDLRLKVPPTVKVLQAAYKFMPGMADNTIVHVAVEDLSTNPQIRDAVDYFDAMRRTFTESMRPAGFKYSETQAEQLGVKQFAFLDISSDEGGKKRMYATVRKNYAIVFTMTYADDTDLQIMQSILAAADFKYKKSEKSEKTEKIEKTN